ncbi:MAG: hypothetical protein Q4E57_06530 [Eubacteriales bacterium]|nr:hypothetical protein [Eubacteriales bacterium]
MIRPTKENKLPNWKQKGPAQQSGKEKIMKLTAILEEYYRMFK